MDINNIEPQQSFLCFAFHFHFLKEVTVTCNSYLSVASAASTVTLSSVASRYGRPRSKYLMSRSTKGKISCRKLTSQQPVLGEKKRCYLKEQQHGCTGSNIYSLRPKIKDVLGFRAISLTRFVENTCNIYIFK